jgi:hypothetical protein
MIAGRALECAHIAKDPHKRPGSSQHASSALWAIQQIRLHAATRGKEKVSEFTTSALCSHGLAGEQTPEPDCIVANGYNG